MTSVRHQSCVINIRKCVSIFAQITNCLHNPNLWDMLTGYALYIYRLYISLYTYIHVKFFKSVCMLAVPGFAIIAFLSSAIVYVRDCFTTVDLTRVANTCVPNDSSNMGLFYLKTYELCQLYQAVV